MSKKIYLYSEDKKYKCAVELADACDKFGCPDHSMIILTEERPDGTYVIAQAKDRILETEKDQQIAELQKQLEEKEKEIEDLRKIHSIKDDVSQCEVVNGVKFYTEQIMIVQILKYNYEMQINNLKQQLKSQPKEIVEKIRKWGLKHYNCVGDGTGYDGQDYNECIGFNMAVDQLNEILDAILNGVSYD